ncbi:J domain-containing protein [Parvibaculum sp.]|uniref:J domain-containing protein n=1 Tax=Parvibaculum sp. TaxID=2024848 RepID=UPI002734008E|nr:J domain-containing protein [Parvibaculum sp.]MDP3328734.1 J domain-containing protein [Parvibaculum sp.]
MIAQAYPLQWPETFPRRPVREAGQFKTSLASALENVQRSIRLFAADSGKKIEGMVISSNVTLGAQRPDDPGVAVWFTWDGMSVCFAVDRYSKVEANLQAIHHIIEARRTELRHGTLALVRATFQGFVALPAPAKRTWKEVLGVGQDGRVTRADIDAAYRRLAKERHPDKPGGSEASMAELNAAHVVALGETS